MDCRPTTDAYEFDIEFVPEVTTANITPNPEGQPTDDLEKLKIDEKIYKIKDPEVHDWAREEEKPDYTKEEVGLGEVDNTSDKDKPVSDATQEALDLKADASSVYTTTQTDKLLLDKVDNSELDNYYDKNVVDDLLLDKADSSSVYTKTEANNLLDDKVDKVVGKGLSEEDFTSDFKTKLQGISAGAEPNVQSDFNQTDNTKDDFIKNKPTKLSDFENDEKFVSNTVNNLVNYYKKTETYTQAEVNALISSIVTISIAYVQVLPQTGEENVIYLVPKSDPNPENVCDEYIYIYGQWEAIGTTRVDLSNYYTKTESDNLLNGKADKSDTYTKSEVNSALDNKADKSNTYTKTETDTLLNGKVDKDGENVVNGKMISGTDYVPETITDTTKSSGWYDNSGNLISSPTKCTTGFLTLSGMADSIDVYGVYTSATLVAKNNNEQCTGWNYNTLPNEFVTKYSDHITIDIEYLRNDSRKSIAINYANNSGYYTYIQKTYLSPKNLDWLRLTRKNGRFPIIVDANGNGDYTTIQAAVNAAYNFDEIIILPGSYEESVTVQNKFLYLHGLDKNTTFLVNHTGDYDTPPLFMCLGIVEGLTIYNQKTVEVSVERHSYAIHLDQLWGNTKALRSFTLRDCNIISDFAGAIGCGMEDGSKVTIEHCYVISTGVTSQDTTAFQIHGNRFAEGSSEIIVIDSVLKAPTTGDAKGLLITNGGSDKNTGTTFNLRVNNCVITKFRENVDSLLTIDNMSYGNNVDALNLATEY